MVIAIVAINSIIIFYVTVILETPHALVEPSTRTDNMIHHGVLSPMKNSGIKAILDHKKAIIDHQRAVYAKKSVATQTDILTKPLMTITSKHLGRLGNSMFQRASLYGLSLRLNRTAVLVDCTVLQRLKYVYAIPVHTMDTKKWNQINWTNHGDDKGAFSFDARILHLDRRRNWRLNGYLQSYKFFENYESEIRKLYKLTPGYHSQAQSYLRTLSKTVKNPVFIGIHVRRQDYASNYKFHTFQSPKIDYFQRAISYYKTKLKGNLILVVASDDYKWCNASFSSNVTGNLPVHFPRKDYLHDMAIMNSCNHSIMSVGSYSWWSSWLAGGEVIYSKTFLRLSNPTWKVKNYTVALKLFSEYFPPHWHPM